MKRLLIGLLALLAACTSTSDSLQHMYEDSIRERDGGVFSTLDSDYMERQESRRVKVRKYVVEQSLETAEDYLYAGAILSSSPEEDDLIAAQLAGLTAAQMGEDRGFRVAAEAIDRIAMHQGIPQRYGTQFYYEAVLAKWRLYPVDPKTTDIERKSMGVDSLADLMKRADELNEKVR